MARDYRHALDDMLEAIEGIQNTVAGKTLADYQANWTMRHAVQRGIEIISEASRALPDQIKALRPDVPWLQVRNVGNLLRHEYHRLSDAVIWGVAIDELGPLKAAIEDIADRLTMP